MMCVGIFSQPCLGLGQRFFYLAPSAPFPLFAGLLAKLGEARAEGARR